MADFSIGLLGITIFISCLGLVGNVFLIISILQNRHSRVKPFELFLLGLATANLEEILIVNIYDITIHGSFKATTTATGAVLCRVVKFLTVFGEISSILFTILISIFRYLKLRNAGTRVNLPILLDNIRSAWMVSAICVMMSALMSFPVFVVRPQDREEEAARNSSACPPDFFQCNHSDCPIFNRAYKYLFIVLCNLVPLFIVTATSVLIIMVLLRQRGAVQPAESVSGSSQFRRSQKDQKLQRSTIAVLAAMGLFQVDWTIYLVFHLTMSPSDFPFWTEMEFFISTSYTSISPYVYGIGTNLFSLRFLSKNQ